MIKITVLFLAGYLMGPLSTPSCRNEARALSPARGTPAGGQTIWPAIALDPFAAGLSSPLHVTHAADGSGRVFIIEQPGRIRIVKGQSLLGQPFLAIESRVLAGGERGLLSVAFPPGYSAKRYFYVDYTREPDGATVISRFRLTADPDQADPASEQILLTIPQPYSNHNGGQLAVGPLDGYLYIGMGDGGSGGDPLNNAQNPDSLLGKILRIDVESGTFPYAIPLSNPFIGRPGYRPEIWALGLRNPWRFSFDRLTGDLYIADVGQNAWEEVDFQPANAAGGANYGWRVLEGAHCYNPSSGCVPPGDYAPPVSEYDHNQGCSITGGFVYRGTLFPKLQGVYFYGDFCSGRIWGLRLVSDQWEGAELLATPYSISSFGEDEAGNLYLADLGGAVYSIRGVNTGTAVLEIRTGAGGTTNPPPGTYGYDAPASVTISAVPEAAFGFQGWTGDASGRANPLSISLAAGAHSVTASFVKVQAPVGAAVRQVVNRSLSQAEAINVLEWQPHPANENISSYRVYLVTDSGRALLASVDATTLTYRHRRAVPNAAASYAVAAVNDEGREGESVIVSL